MRGAVERRRRARSVTRSSAWRSARRRRDLMRRTARCGSSKISERPAIGSARSGSRGRGGPYPRRPWHAISSSASSERLRRISAGSPTSRTCRRPRAFSISRSSWMCSVGASWAARCATRCTRPWYSMRSTWRRRSGAPRQSFTTPPNTDCVPSGSDVSSSACDRRWARAAMRTTTPWQRASSPRSNASASRSIASHRTRTSRLVLFRYIESGYNPHRRDSALGQRSPLAFEQLHTVPSIAA